MKFLLAILGVALIVGCAAPSDSALRRTMGGTVNSGIALSPKEVSWGMVWDDVWNALAPAYGSRMDFSRPFGDVGILEIKNYANRGCKFSLKYWFYDDRLDALNFETDNDTRCISGIERELSAFYGPPQENSDGSASSSWNTDRAKVELWRNDNVMLLRINDPHGHRVNFAPDVILNLDGGVPPR